MGATRSERIYVYRGYGFPRRRPLHYRIRYTFGTQRTVRVKQWSRDETFAPRYETLVALGQEGGIVARQLRVPVSR